MIHIQDSHCKAASVLELLTNGLPDMLWIKDLNGIYLYANQAICDGLLMAKDTNEPIGKNDVFFAKRERELHKENPQWHTFGELCFNSDVEVINNNEPMKFEEYGNVKGKMLYLEVFKAPFYDENGEIAGTVGAGRDITKLKQTQLDLEKTLKEVEEKKEEVKSLNTVLEERIKEEVEKRQAQEQLMIRQSRHAAMGEMIEMIAHQWRQPLNIIGLAISNLETQKMMGLYNEENLTEKLEIISHNTSYMSNTIDTFREFLSPKKELESFSLTTVATEVTKVLEAQFKINCITCRVKQVCDALAKGNENELKQVLFILFNNSIYAINKGISTGMISDGIVDVEVSCGEDCVRMLITDNGGGIPQENLTSIFEPYFTTKGELHGTGLGLYIAKTIIEKMSGHISVKNSPLGASFTIKLPFSQ